MSTIAHRGRRSGRIHHDRWPCGARPASRRGEHLVGLGPQQGLRTEAGAQPQPPLLAIDHQQLGAALTRRQAHAVADRPGPQNDHALPGRDPGPDHGADSDRHRLDHRGDGGILGTDREHLLLDRRQTLLQAGRAGTARAGLRRELAGEEVVIRAADPNPLRPHHHLAGSWGRRLGAIKQRHPPHPLGHRGSHQPHTSAAVSTISSSFATCCS
jgi:hypothetical protein